MSKVQPISIDLIDDSAETQSRAVMDQEHVNDLRAAWEAKADIPALLVFKIGERYRLADGYHRLAGAKLANRSSVPCEVRHGTARDAWLAALQANRDHLGLRRTNADKRRVVMQALGDDELVKWSDRKVAEHVGVSDPFVSAIRKELLAVSSSPAAKTKDEPKIGKDGKSRKPPKKSTKKKSQASVSGSDGKHSSAASPDLPPVGTVNRTDKGSQDSGDAGECPKGGEHKWVDGACKKCHEPEPAKNGQTDFDPATLDKQLAAHKSGELDLTPLQSKYDVMLNAITQIKKIWNEVTADERDGAYAVSKRQRVLSLLDELRPPIAQARPMKVCTFCKGKGCEKCSGCGWWPRSVVEGLSR